MLTSIVAWIEPLMEISAEENFSQFVSCYETKERDYLLFEIVVVIVIVIEAEKPSYQSAKSTEMVWAKIHYESAKSTEMVWAKIHYD